MTPYSDWASAHAILFSDWFLTNYLRLFIIIISCCLIYSLMTDVIRQKRLPDINSVSTFFSLDHLTSSAFFRGICFFFSGSLSIIYAAIALDAGSLLTSTKKLLQMYALKELDGDLKYAVSQVFDAIPSWLEPIFVLLVFMLLFWEKTRPLLILYRDVILRASGIYSLIDDESMESARLLMKLSKDDFAKASEKIEQMYGELPVPEQFLRERNEKRLAFQIIWANRTSIFENGFVKANERQKKDLGLPYSNDTSLGISLVHMGASIIIFSVMMSLYLGVVPTLSILIKNQYHLAWPDANVDGWSALIRYILKDTLSFVFPMILAINMFPIRRFAYKSKETAGEAFWVVAVAQWIFSFCVQEVFNVLDVSVAMSRDQNYSFSMPRVHIAAVLYSITPILAYGILLKLKMRSLRVFIPVALVSIVVSLWFGCCDVIYECYLEKFDFFFVHQALLGLFVSVAFFSAGSLTGSTSQLFRVT